MNVPYKEYCTFCASTGVVPASREHYEKTTEAINKDAVDNDGRYPPIWKSFYKYNS